METEETNTTEAPEIHCKEFQIESGNTEEGNYEIAGPSMRIRGGLFSPRTLGRHKFSSISFSF